MADTIEQIILDVQSVCPDADPNLARLWVRNAARRTLEARQWSFMLKRGQLIVPAPISSSASSTVSVIESESEITFLTAIATESMVGWQFRVSDTGPMYDVVGYVSTTKLRIYPEWSGDTAAAQPFKLYKSKFALPNDCIELLSVVSARDRWQLWLNVPQEVLDGGDPGRNRVSGSPSVLSPCDYSQEFSGSVSAAIIVTGSGPKPITDGVYAGQANALYTVHVTTGGVGGSAVFKWKKDEGTFVTGVVSDGSMGNELSDGVTVLWPTSSTFVLNDVFIVAVSANSTAASPRVEIYPRPAAESVLTYLYVTRYPDLTDNDIQIPGMLQNRTDIILEKALEFAAAWPGTEDRPNAYNQINRRDYHGVNWYAMTMELAKQDNALFQRNVLPAQRITFAPWPFSGGRNMQEHDNWLPYPTDNLY